jgi:hypothetical protein
MTTEIKNSLPFFSYGFFRPGEISFLGIKDYVKNAKPLKIEGDLVLRDGVTLFKDSKNQMVDGYLISFKPEFENEAYSFINSFTAPKINWRFSASYDSFVFNQTFVLHMNIFDKNRQLLVSTNRYLQCWRLCHQKLDFLE